MIEDEFNNNITLLDNQIAEASEIASRNSENRIAGLNNQKRELEKEYEDTKTAKKMVIDEFILDREYLINRKEQMPFTVLFTGLWLVIFGGIVLAFLVAYLGNVYYDLFLFRNDKALSYFTYLIKNEREKDYKQPLLGFTLLIITLCVLFLIFNNKNQWITEFLHSITSIF